MPRRRDEWDQKVHVHHTTRADDREDGIRRCASCGTPVGVGAECVRCGLSHPVDSVLGWLGWGIDQVRKRGRGE